MLLIRFVCVNFASSCEQCKRARTSSTKAMQTLSIAETSVYHFKRTKFYSTPPSQTQAKKTPNLQASTTSASKKPHSTPATPLKLQLSCKISKSPKRPSAPSNANQCTDESPIIDHPLSRRTLWIGLCLRKWVLPSVTLKTSKFAANPTVQLTNIIGATQKSSVVFPNL